MKHTSVHVKVDERLGAEKSIRRFKRLCESFGVVKEYRKRKEYKKPSIQIAEKTAASLKRRAKSASRSNRNSKI